MAFDLQGLFRAIEQRDVEGFLNYLADDVEVWSEDEPQPLRGKATLRPLVEMSLPIASQLKIRPERIVEDQGHVAVLADVAGEYKSDLPLPGGARLPIGGKPLRIKASMFLDIDKAGRITRLHRVRDTLSAVRQLGFSPQQLEDARESILRSITEQPGYHA